MYICIMDKETRIVNKNTGIIHKIDQVYYYDNDNYVIFTDDKFCFPSSIVRILTESEKYDELSKHIVLDLNKNGSLDRLKIIVKKRNKQRNERIYQNSDTPITGDTNRLRKVLSNILRFKW
jgi:hypothetical protein